MNRKTYGFFAVCLLCCLGVFLLYRVPWEAIVYAMLLCLAIGAAVGAVYRYRHRKRLGMIRVAAQNPQMAELPLPEAESDTEEEYRRLVMALRADLTRRREEYESALREMRDDYTLWAHQIKTPIAALRLQLGEERQEEMIELQRIEDYVEMALTVQRLNGGDLMPQECDLDAVIKKSVRKHARMFIRKRLYLRYEPSGARAVTDEKWLAFILEQVLVNAIKYTEIGGITIAWKEDTLTVADTGIGIAAEDLPRVFERGYTGMNGRIDGRATGMGLYLCRRAARMLGHGLKIESEAGKGTRVSICFARPKLAVD